MALYTALERSRLIEPQVRCGETAMRNSFERRRMSRRGFVKRAAAGAAAIGLPLMLHADDKAGGKAPILGSGEHTYEAIHGWAQVPEGMQFGNTHMVQEDAQGRILV